LRASAPITVRFVIREETNMPTEKQAAPVTTEDILEDLRAVVRDADALLRATEGQAGEKIADIRAHAEESLGSARQRLSETGARFEAHARSAARSTDTYVRENPWTAVAIAVGIGFVLGNMGRRR
jgi:ElaB/YqjD/DUF883 family membrane-anchored ribosome-binding protein